MGLIRPITLDDREQRSPLAAALRRVLGAGAAIKMGRLALGDIQIGDAAGVHYLIERKTVEDLLLSERDGRLRMQLERLLKTGAGARTVLLVEGELRADAEADALRAVILEVQLGWHLPVLMTRDAEESARWIAALARGAAEGFERGPAFSAVEGAGSGQGVRHAHGAAPKRGVNALQLAALAQIDGVGQARAKRLLERFGALQAVHDAGTAELQQVDGIGAELAGRIVRALGQRR